MIDFEEREGGVRIFDDGSEAGLIEAITCALAAVREDVANGEEAELHICTGTGLNCRPEEMDDISQCPYCLHITAGETRTPAELARHVRIGKPH